MTEHKETADIINEHLNSAVQALGASEYYLLYCKTPFSVTAFLQHKLNLAQPRMNLNCYARGRSASTTDSPNPELYQAIKRWRDIQCEEEDLPVFLVVTHAGMKDICTYLPKTKRDLLLISGFGKVKVDKYGDEITGMVTDYCELHNIESNTGAKKASSKKERKPKADKVDTKDSTYGLFKAGKTIAEIATERGFAQSTIEGHLAALIEKGKVAVGEVLSAEKFKEISNVFKTRGNKTLSEMKAEMPWASFGEMRMAEAGLKVANPAI